MNATFTPSYRGGSGAPLVCLHGFTDTWRTCTVRYEPRAAAGCRELLPHADWIVLDGVGHCPQLDVPFEPAQLILGLTAR